MSRKRITARAGIVDRILEANYGEKKQTEFLNPTEELILTVLSQNTNDKNRDRAYRSLRRKFPRWGDIASARPSAVAEAIRPGGLANIKSARIIRILKQINSRSSGYSLAFLKRMADREVWEYLMGFEGVGPKTASCVMMFSLGRRTMPVDTHVHRVGRRLGLIPDGYSAEKAHEWFMDLNLPVDVYQLHMNMIAHGRTLCRPRNPVCQECPLTRQCLYYRDRM
jgi:endonuclease-3